MKKCFVYLFINACLFNVYNATVLDLNGYLHQKGNYLQEMFNKENFLQHKRDSNIAMVKNYQESIYPELTDHIKIFSLFNSTHIITKNGVYEIINNSIILRQDMGRLKKIFQKKFTTFFKSVMFNDTGFIVFNSEFTGDAYIFQLINGSYNLIQNIKSPYATDAHFFINNNNLYLIMVNNKGGSMAETSICKWLGFHFDEIQTVFTTEAIKVGSFTTRTAEIIIILQDIPNKALSSAVFKFSNDEIKKIQLLKTYHGIHLETYTSTNKKYLIIFNRIRNNVIYEWNDYQFILQSKFQTEEMVHNSQIFILNGTPFLGISFSNKLQIFNLIYGKIRLVNEIKNPSELTKIIDFHIEKNGTTYIIESDEKTKVKRLVISSAYNFTNTDLNLVDRDVLRECFKALEIKVDSANRKLVGLKKKISEKARFRREVVQNIQNSTQESAIEYQIQILKKRFAEINSIVDNYKFPVENNIVINGKVNFKGGINSKKITGINIVIKEINGKKWVPEQWLRYTEPQTISGLSKVKTITANEVETSSTDSLFNDLLLKNKDQTINGSVSIEFLNVPKLYVKNINGIPMEEVYYKNKPQQIKGVKTFKYLNADEFNMTSINKDSPDEIISSVLSLPNLDLDSNITVENLEVETINGIDWKQLKENVFKINISKEITGPITFTKIKTKQLTAKKIKDINANHILTTTTDQIIESNMEFTHIFTNELKLQTVNGIKIPQDIVFANKNTTIQGHIKMDKIKVLKNVTLSGKFDDSFFLKDEGHIMGTNMSDLLQIYSGKITINGNLYLSNLKLLPNATLFVSGTKVNPNFTEIYWTKNTHQIISVPVNFLQGIITPHLLNKILNNVKMDQYMLNNNEGKLETDFKFENVTIKGNVVLNNAAHHRPNFNNLLKEAVQTTGNYMIHGKKTYLKTLKAENLQTLDLDGVNVDEALNIKWTKNVTGTKTFKNIIVKNDVDIAIDGVKIINGISVENFLQKVIFVDRPVNITHLDFENIIVINLHVNELDNHTLEEYTSLTKNLQNAKVINKLQLKGNATIDHIKNIVFLNNKAFSELLKNRQKPRKHGILNEEVEFTGKIKVKNFIADHVNDISVRNLTRKVLNRQYPQTIIAPHTFSNLKAGNILTKKINNVSIENIIDTLTTLPQQIFSPNGSVSLSNMAIMKNLEAAQIKPCGLDTIHIEFTDPPTQKWTEILIKGNVTVLDEESFLYRLFEKTVKLNIRNVIHSDVNILSRASMKNLDTNNLVNNVHIPHLLEDAVLTKSDVEQKITGEKWFTILRTKVAAILGDANADFVNHENVTALDNDIVDKNGDNIIRGKKIFYRGLQTKKFYSKTVSGVNPDDIVNLDQPKHIPEAVCDTLDVKGELNIKIYNKQNFTDFIKKRLLINGFENQVATGIYYFDNIEVQNFTTPYINNIKVQDIVFDEGIQNINSVKHFKQSIIVYGNISANFIDGVNVTYEFLNSIPLKGSVEMDSNIVVIKSSNINGSLTTKSINGFNVTSIKELLSSNIDQIETEEIHYLKEQLIKKINKNIPIIQSLPSYFMYLEKSNSLQIKLPNTLSGSTITSNSYVLLHINGQESGTHCNLPSNCSCPVQYTIEISPQKSITKFPNKGFQRLFSYDDDSMTINFMTNSVSRSSTCRTSQSKVYNEISMLTWNTKTQDSTIGQFHQYDKFLSGYVSKVDFFTLNGKTYAVVGRYYDPVTDKYELDCSVLRFNENKTRVLEIQIIPTKGVEEVYLLPTAQGVVLILGNKIPFKFHHEQEETQIFRFNPEKEQFVLLRTITSFGCSNAVGVVHGSDSLIALAHKEAPVQVLKYYPEFDNYYFYQSFELDQPVIGISSFYTGGFGISDAYLSLVTSHEKYYIYAYQFLEGFKLKSTGKLDGLRNLVSFKLNKQTYLFAPSAQYSSLIRVVKNRFI